MSRRPIVAANADARANSELSRRQLIAGSAAVAIVSDIPAYPDPAISACKTWLVLEAEHEALTRRWQKLDNYLIQERYWCDLSQNQCAPVPEAIELEAVDLRLDAMFEKRQKLLTNLPALPASTVQGVALKLAIAAIVVQPDENENAHNLVVSILRDLKKITV